MFRAAATMRELLDQIDPDRTARVPREKSDSIGFWLSRRRASQAKKMKPVAGANPARHQGIGEIYDPREKSFVEDYRPKTRKWRVEEEPKKPRKGNKYSKNGRSKYYYDDYDYISYYSKSSYDLYDRYRHCGKSDEQYLQALADVKYHESKNVNGLVVDAYIDGYDHDPRTMSVIVYVTFRHETDHISRVAVSCPTSSLMRYFYDSLKAGVNFIMEQAWAEFSKKESSIREAAYKRHGINAISTRDKAVAAMEKQISTLSRSFKEAANDWGDIVVK
tara:strand:- start:1365 stop:2192 length:828 start_codon:yes stop_codon:yes gene_type:complete